MSVQLSALLKKTKNTIRYIINCSDLLEIKVRTSTVFAHNFAPPLLL